jgi:hypothetical protein
MFETPLISGSKTPDFNQPERLPLKGWQPLSPKDIEAEYPIGQLNWSPDGKRLAFVSIRPGDMWSIIWLTDTRGSYVQDLLPPAVSERFNSPGTRAVAISGWLSNKDLAFSQHVGTGAVAYHKVDVERMTYGALCVADQDGDACWSPTGKRLIIEGHLGALIAEDCRFKTSRSLRPCRKALPGGCSLDASEEWQGQWYGFDDWSPDSKHLAVRLDRPGRTFQSSASYIVKIHRRGVPSAFVGLWRAPVHVTTGNPQSFRALSDATRNLAIAAPNNNVDDSFSATRFP